MHCFPTRWTKALAAAAIVALPLAASAQTPDTKVDAAASKMHLSAARDTLSQLTSMPEAARLQGETRTQVSQIISSFNDLITTQADWRSAYAKVDGALTALLGPDTAEPAPAATGVTGAVGTSGAAPATTLDPAVRAKLVEFRTHLKEFERAAGGATTPAATPASPATGASANPPASASAASPATPPASASAASPATPPASASAASPTTPPASASAVSPTTPPAPAATAATAEQPKAAEPAGRADIEKHLDAISAILDRSKTGTLTKAQTAALKKHVADLRILLQQSR